jgi:hypothetical protein
MNRALKIGLIVTGGLAVAGVGTWLILKARNKKKEEDLDKKLADENKQQLEQISSGLGSTQSGNVQQINANCNPQYLTPVRNLNKDVNNPYKEVKGKTIYPAKKSDDPFKGHPFASGYATIRNSAEVNNKNGTFDISNKVGTISGSSKIGTIVSEKYDNHDPKHRWFKVKLAKKMEDCSGYTGGFFGCDEVTYGWVRADNVTFPKSGKGTYSLQCQMKEMCAGKTDKTSDKVGWMTYSSFKSMDKTKACAPYGGYKGGSSFIGDEVEFDLNNFILQDEVFSGIGGQEFDVAEVLTDLD